MSTATQNVTSALDTSSELQTVAQVIVVTGKDEQSGKDTYSYLYASEEQGKEAETKAEFTAKVKGKEVTFPVHAVNYQTVKFWKANSLKGIEELFTDETGKLNEEEVCNMSNRGTAVKQANKIRQLIEATDEDGNPTFEFSGNVFDLRPFIATTTSTRKSATEKVLDTLKGMNPEQVAQIMAALQALQSGS